MSVIVKQLTSRILDFWFAGAYANPAMRDKGALMKIWWQGDRALDLKIKEEFEENLQNHLVYKDEMKLNGPESTLAYILLVDQFPRNMYRNSAKAFEFDPFAREMSLYALENRYDQLLDYSSRMFIYLPLEHAEDIEMQKLCLEKMKQLESDDPEGSKGLVKFATDHLEIIERFGRFPHRNAILGRQDTAEEEAFLAEKGGSMFGQGKKEDK